MCRDIGGAPGESAVQEWRDWANFLPELVDDISGRLLAADVAEYRRFRAGCKPWRDLTADPDATPLNSRFRPRNWVVIGITPGGSSMVRRHLLHLSTAASLAVDLPPLSTHCHLCAADGLLVLYHRSTAVVSLLDPLTNAVTEFPSITSVVDSAGPQSKPPEFVSRYSQSFISRALNGAALDDSTAPPTLVLCLRGGMCNMVVAKPGDAHWTRVNEGEASYPLYSMHDTVLFYSLLSMEGRCYVSSPEGSIYLVNQQPLPRLVEAVNQRCLAVPEVISNRSIISFLFRDDGGGRMMMARYWKGMQHFTGLQQGSNNYNRKQDLFKVGSVTSRIELLEVDLIGRRLVPVRSLGRNAVFLGFTHCVLVSTEVFPSITADAMYLGCLHQCRHRFSVYHIIKRVKKKRTRLPHKFVWDEDRGLAPATQPCNLDHYLVYYVDRVHGHGSSGACINHIDHQF